MFNALFTKTDEYARLAQALGGPGACALFGIPGSGRAMVYAALAKALDKPLCIVTPGEAEATRFAGDLNALGVAAAVFPARDYVLRPIEGTGREYEYRRLAVLGDLVGGRLQAVCVPDEGLTQYTTPRADFCANTRSLRPGDALPSIRLLAKELRISVITTKRAYEDLERDGFILTQQGRGSFVAEQNPALLREEHLKKVEDCLQGAVDAARLGGIGYDEVAETLHLLWEG